MKKPRASARLKELAKHPAILKARHHIYHKDNRPKIYLAVAVFIFALTVLPSFPVCHNKKVPGLWLVYKGVVECKNVSMWRYFYHNGLL